MHVSTLASSLCTRAVQSQKLSVKGTVTQSESEFIQWKKLSLRIPVSSVLAQTTLFSGVLCGF